MNRQRCDAQTISVWRIYINGARIELGAFNWPWALTEALDEIEALRSQMIVTTEDDNG